MPLSHLPGVTSPAGRLTGQSTRDTYTNFAGTLSYHLYRPARLRRPPPLFVMLHGGFQSAADFAIGTRMNEVADECGGMVLYPEQSSRAHPLGCWNWYDTGHQSAETGEPALIAGLTRHVMAEHEVDPQRVYVAGLSAGGAMAVILGRTYPGLFAAVGVHSGLPFGVAHDLWSAMEAMRQGPARDRCTGIPRTERPMSIIVFQGDCDSTVHPSNGEAVLAQALGEATFKGLPAALRQSDRTVTRMTRQRSNGGRGAKGELWLLHGAGHAWAGGNRLGSFTDEKGPDASREMTRFFLKQRLSNDLNVKEPPVATRVRTKAKFFTTAPVPR